MLYINLHTFLSVGQISMLLRSAWCNKYYEVLTCLTSVK